MPEANWLVAAISGRALAASAARGGHRVVVLDCFADRDTCEAAVACRAVVARDRLHFDRRALFAAARTLGAGAGLVYGSGFEGRTDWLARLATGRHLAGNPPPVVAAVRDPRRFFPLLARLGINSPQTRTSRPASPEGWLAKRPGAAGGVGVRWLTPSTAAPRGSYFQRWEPGRLRSVLFLADGTRARIVGWNRAWVAPASNAPFLYGGAVGGVTLPQAVEADLRERLPALVRATGLRGLNGLDFLVQGDRWLALELNPRPTATLDLYDADWPQGLFEAHLASCRGALPAVPRRTRARAHAIIRAPRAWTAPAALRLPEWCTDLPRAGTRFAAGDPVCTVHADGPEPRAAVRQLRRRRASLLARLGQRRTALT